MVLHFLAQMACSYQCPDQLQLLPRHCRSSRPEVFCSGLRPTTLLKKRLQHGCFLVNFVKFLRTPFSQNTSGGCFWHWQVRCLGLLETFRNNSLLLYRLLENNPSNTRNNVEKEVCGITNTNIRSNSYQLLLVLLEETNQEQSSQDNQSSYLNYLYFSFSFIYSQLWFSLCYVLWCKKSFIICTT